jgi:hypothetical protein
MGHFAGLDVSVKQTSVCIVDDTGKTVREVKVARTLSVPLVVEETDKGDGAAANLRCQFSDLIVGDFQRCRVEARRRPSSTLDCATAMAVPEQP